MGKLTEEAKGVYVIAVTPFLGDGALDLESVDSMVQERCELDVDVDDLHAPA